MFIVAVGAVGASVSFPYAFAPQEGLVAPAERPYRAELCLNGRWGFQPVPIPAEYVRNQGTPPDLTPSGDDRWEKTPIKIPSPWNVNIWGGGRNTGEGTQHPYWPNSLTYPSYPSSWDGVEMGWLRRRFRVPADWKGRRLLLHFEAVAGECQVLVNGQRVGEHFDSYTPFECDTTAQVKPGEDNELLVGVRRHTLFAKTDPGYPKFRNPFPNGSNTEPLVGIWQDVTLLAVAPVHIDDTFVKPLVSKDRLEVEVTVANAGTQPQRVTLGGSVSPWVNLAGTSVTEAPVPKGKLGAPVLSLPVVSVTVPAGGSTTATLSAPVQGRLKLWSPDAPHLNGLVLSVSRGKETVDRRYTRFGWREATLRGSDLLLNGHKIQLFGDLVHPFGTFVMSRRYAWAWYRMVKDYGGNAVRLHAQPMPRFYLDLADEMGVMVLDETAIFGSSINLNFEEPVAWTRFADHYDALVRRDRNHPSVFGWSFGNELFAIFSFNKVPPAQADQWYAQLTELGRRALKLDPTRNWISCDGDEDLKGTLPVWAKHFGHGLHLDALSDNGKALMVGESGGTYYAKPPRLIEFNGNRAYESYEGRNEALAIDLYRNVTQMARPKLAFYSASETVWFGLEHLAYGYKDFTRLPSREDGVVFTRPFVEGEPGWQPERLSPYVATLNPGWDPDLPLYKPLAMFDAMKAALAPGGPAPSPYDHRPAPIAAPTPAAPTIGKVAFVGPQDGSLGRQLLRWGVPLAPEGQTQDAEMLILDGARLSPGDAAAVKRQMADVLGRGGVVLVMMGESGAQADSVNALLPAPIELTARDATMLMPEGKSAWTAALRMPDLYFVEDAADKRILKHGIAGPFVAQGETLLQAANIDWTLFDNAENVKCGALVLYEHLKKPEGAALVAMVQGGGRIAVSTIETGVASPGYVALWRKLFAGMGVRLEAPRSDAASGPAGPEGDHDLLRDGPGATPK